MLATKVLAGKREKKFWLALCIGAEDPAWPIDQEIPETPQNRGAAGIFSFV
jgi:hypothetical protein